MSRWPEADWVPLPSISGGRLLGALLTTYEPPDPNLLAEDLLPEWLGLAADPRSEGDARALYLVELDEALKGLRGRIGVFSSPQRASAETAHWIWRLVRRFHTGAQAPVVQHAKLWMLHWSQSVAAGTAHEVLEIVVSSANLTRSALRDQIQAGWRAVLPLQERGSRSRLQAWGCLGGFLDALSAASGPGAMDLVSSFKVLLSRAEAPRDVQFLASVPGEHRRGAQAGNGAAWGASALAAVLAAAGRGSPAIDVIAPTLGEWSESDVKAFASHIRTPLARVQVGWLESAHPWSIGFNASASTCRALREAGVLLRSLPRPDTDDGAGWLDLAQSRDDPRWLHAKVYGLRRGTWRRTLITSANFSRSAWGRTTRAGALEIGNFELGVVVPSRRQWLAELDAVSKPHTGVEQERDFLSSAWGDATWDGAAVCIVVRPPATGEHAAPTVVVRTVDSSSDAESEAIWRRVGGLFETVVPWTTGVPLAVVVSCAEEHLCIPVADLRPHAVLVDAPFPGLDPAAAEAARIQLVFARYGGLSRELDDGDGSGGPRQPGPSVACTVDSYTVPVFERARSNFALIDKWQHAMDEAPTELEQHWVLRDGETILGFWRREVTAAGVRAEGVPASLAVIELEHRLSAARGGMGSE